MVSNRFSSTEVLRKHRKVGNKMSEVTGKEMITRFLDRIAVTARIAVESGECSKDEMLDYITQYGNKKIIDVMEMKKSRFAMLAMMELVKTSVEIEEEERGE